MCFVHMVGWRMKICWNECLRWICRSMFLFACLQVFWGSHLSQHSVDTRAHESSNYHTPKVTTSAPLIPSFCFTWFPSFLVGGATNWVERGCFFNLLYKDHVFLFPENCCILYKSQVPGRPRNPNIWPPWWPLWHLVRPAQFDLQCSLEVSLRGIVVIFLKGQSRGWHSILVAILPQEFRREHWWDSTIFCWYI